jgi:hypothetical protein
MPGLKWEEKGGLCREEFPEEDLPIMAVPGGRKGK